MKDEIKKVKKLIIPAAGWGTRFLPLTKSVYKELLPVLNKPLIHYLAEEAIDSGIEELIIVLSDRKKGIENYFNIDESLNSELKSTDKINLLNSIKNINNKIKISFEFQKEQLGLAHAIHIGSKNIGDEPFAVILGDDLIKNNIPAIKQLIDAYYESGNSVLGIKKLDIQQAKKYGVVESKKPIKNNIFNIKKSVEKPSKPPTNYCIIGRYVFNANARNLLWNYKYEKNEVQLLDIFNKLSNIEEVKGLILEGNRYDLGSIDGFIKANIDYALDDKKLKGNILDFISKK